MITKIVEVFRLPILYLGFVYGIRNRSSIESIVIATLKKCIQCHYPLEKGERSRKFVLLLTHYLKAVKLRTGWNCRKARLALRPLAAILDEAIDTFLELKNPFHFYAFDAISSRHLQDVLQSCRIPRPLSYKLVLPPWKLKSVKKISEGSYGEIYLFEDIAETSRVLKIVSVYGSLKDNPTGFLDLVDVVADAMCSKHLSTLTNPGVFQAPNFPICHSIDLVKGKPPKPIVEAWSTYEDSKDEEEGEEERLHIRPDLYTKESLFLVMELENCGKDLLRVLSQGEMSGMQAISLILQTASSLAVAERAFGFEHRDLHTGNWMLKETKQTHMTYSTELWSWKIPTFNVKAFIIDFTLSRIEVDGNIFAMDLTNLSTSGDDESFVEAHVEIYQKMKEEFNGDFDRFFPKTNIWFMKHLIVWMLAVIQNRYNNSEEDSASADEIALYILHRLGNNIERYSNTLDFLKTEVFEILVPLGSL